MRELILEGVRQVEELLIAEKGFRHGKTIPRTSCGVLKVDEDVEKLLSNSQFFGQLKGFTR